jgi:Zn-dependent peptidase ImmA (M78 family)
MAAITRIFPTSINLPALMSIAQLHASFENVTLEDLEISRNVVKERALALSGAPSIKIMKTALDLQVCRGFYLSATNANNPFVAQHGTHVIVVGREQSRCWDRFVVVKELLHLFDTPETATADPEQFGACLSELAQPSGSMSPAGRREFEAMWLAMAILCPERCRERLVEEFNAQRLTYLDIATKLRVPQILVSMLFDDRYDRIVKPFLVERPRIVAARG